MLRLGRLTAVSLALATLAACGVLPGGKRVEDNTITKRQAVARVEQIIRETVASLKPAPQLEIDQPMSQDSKCIDPADGGSPDRIVVGREYLLRGVPRSRNGELARQIKAYWDSKGFKYSNADRLNTNDPDITGFTASDQFRISLSTNDQGVMSIGAGSPCIWPNGTPEPSS